MGALAGDRKHERARLPIAPGEKLLDRHVARPVTTLHRNGGVECQQCNSEIAEWCWREEIAADRAHVAHRRPADRGGDRMEKRELTLVENAREGDAGNAHTARTGELAVRQGAV